MAEKRAWFYLTLWRGTPPEFTSELVADIYRTDSKTANIQSADNAETIIETRTTETVPVHKRHTETVEIITKTEVSFVVG